MPASFTFTLIGADGVATTSTAATPSQLAGADAFRDFKLGIDGDLELFEGDFAPVSGPAGVASDLAATLQTFTGEWFLDVELGIPRSILGAKFNKGRFEQIFREAILARPGVDRLTSLDVTFEARELRVKFRATTDFGEIIEATLTETGG